MIYNYINTKLILKYFDNLKLIPNFVETIFEHSSQGLSDKP